MTTRCAFTELSHQTASISFVSGPPWAHSSSLLQLRPSRLRRFRRLSGTWTRGTQRSTRVHGLGKSHDGHSFFSFTAHFLNTSHDSLLHRSNGSFFSTLSTHSMERRTSIFDTLLNAHSWEQSLLPLDLFHCWVGGSNLLGGR